MACRRKLHLCKIVVYNEEEVGTHTVYCLIPGNASFLNFIELLSFSIDSFILHDVHVVGQNESL